ncbi:hypothetical protein D3C71_1866380 [compost metagenome]
MCTLAAAGRLAMLPTNQLAELAATMRPSPLMMKASFCIRSRQRVSNWSNSCRAISAAATPTKCPWAYIGTENARM